MYTFNSFIYCQIVLESGCSLFSCSVVSNSLWPHEWQPARLPCPSLSPGVCSNSCPLSQRHANISSSVSPFSSCPHSYQISGSFPKSWVLASVSQSTGASASASVLPVNIQGWSPLGWTGLISLQSKGLSRVFSSTVVWKHQFFGTQPSLWSNSHIHTWLLEKPQLWQYRPLSAKVKIVTLICTQMGNVLKFLFFTSLLISALVNPLMCLPILTVSHGFNTHFSEF